MDIIKFGDILIQNIQNCLGESFSVNLQEVVKNNGIVHEAVTIREKGANIAPTIYIDSFFAMYEEGTSIDSITLKVLSLYRKSKYGPGVDLKFYKEFDKAVSHLSFKVALAEPNRSRLKDVPVRYVEDLVMIPICILDIRDNEQGSIMITNEHLDMWEISAEELWENIMDNAPVVFPALVRGITDYIGPQMFDGCDALENVYVVTTNSGYHGAGAVLYPGVLEKISEKVDDDLFVIPSSVHETIVIPTGNCVIPPEALRSIIHEVNHSVVADEEVLSQNLYYYTKELDRLAVCQ